MIDQSCAGQGEGVMAVRVSSSPKCRLSGARASGIHLLLLVLLQPPGRGWGGMTTGPGPQASALAGKGGQAPCLGGFQTACLEVQMAGVGSSVPFRASAWLFYEITGAFISALAPFFLLLSKAPKTRLEARTRRGGSLVPVSPLGRATWPVHLPAASL